MKKWLAGVGLLSLCALCCAFPFLLAGTVGIDGLSINPWIAVGILVVGIMVFFYLKQRKKHVYNIDGNCGCKTKTGGY